MEIDHFNKAVEIVRGSIDSSFEKSRDKLITTADCVATKPGKSSITRWYQSHLLNNTADRFEQFALLKDIMDRSTDITGTPYKIIFSDGSSEVRVTNVMETGKNYCISKTQITSSEAIKKMDGSFGVIYELIRGEERKF